jgi:hypothetical protein
MRRWLAGCLAALFLRPTSTVPLDVIEHGDPDVDDMWRRALVRGRLQPEASPVDPDANREALIDIAPEEFWREIERSVT